MIFDDDYPDSEQIPRRLTAVFTSATGPYGPVVRLVVNGRPLGDPLTDRGWSETGYRWHDALHLAHAVCLGWSPVFRALVADEAIAWATFCYARTHRWLADGPPPALLDRIEEMTYGLEVSRCPRRAWQHTITTGITAMLDLWHSDGGVLSGDLDTGTLQYRPPEAATA